MYLEKIQKIKKQSKLQEFFVFISGNAGCGKSTLCQEIQTFLLGDNNKHRSKFQFEFFSRDDHVLKYFSRTLEKYREVFFKRENPIVHDLSYKVENVKGINQKKYFRQNEDGKVDYNVQSKYEFFRAHKEHYASVYGPIVRSGLCEEILRRSKQSVSLEIKRKSGRHVITFVDMVVKDLDYFEIVKRFASKRYCFVRVYLEEGKRLVRILGRKTHTNTFPDYLRSLKKNFLLDEVIQFCHDPTQFNSGNYKVEEMNKLALEVVDFVVKVATREFSTYEISKTQLSDFLKHPDFDKVRSKLIMHPRFNEFFSRMHSVDILPKWFFDSKTVSLLYKHLRMKRSSSKYLDVILSDVEIQRVLTSKRNIPIILSKETLLFPTLLEFFSDKFGLLVIKSLSFVWKDHYKVKIKVVKEVLNKYVVKDLPKKSFSIVSTDNEKGCLFIFLDRRMIPFSFSQKNVNIFINDILINKSKCKIELFHIKIVKDFGRVVLTSYDPNKRKKFLEGFKFQKKKNSSQEVFEHIELKGKFPFSEKGYVVLFKNGQTGSSKTITREIKPVIFGERKKQYITNGFSNTRITFNLSSFFIEWKDKEYKFEKEIEFLKLESSHFYDEDISYKFDEVMEVTIQNIFKNPKTGEEFRKLMRNRTKSKQLHIVLSALGLKAHRYVKSVIEQIHKVRMSKAVWRKEYREKFFFFLELKKLFYYKKQIDVLCDYIKNYNRKDFVFNILDLSTSKVNIIETINNTFESYLDSFVKNYLKEFKKYEEFVDKSNKKLFEFFLLLSKKASSVSKIPGKERKDSYFKLKKLMKFLIKDPVDNTNEEYKEKKDAIELRRYRQKNRSNFLMLKEENEDVKEKVEEKEKKMIKKVNVLDSNVKENEKEKKNVIDENVESPPVHSRSEKEKQKERKEFKEFRKKVKTDVVSEKTGSNSMDIRILGGIIVFLIVLIVALLFKL